MALALAHLNYLHVIVITIIGFIIGAIWYSPVLFAKPWMAEMKLTPEMCKEKGGMSAAKMIGCLVLTFVSTVALAGLIVRNGSLGYEHGALLGAFVGIGLVGARYATNAMFEFKTCRHVLIVAGHDVVLLAVQGALLARWH